MLFSCIVLEEAAFAARDAHLPSDAERVWLDLPSRYWAVSGPGDVAAAMLAGLGEAGGAWRASIAGALHLFGRSPDTFHAPFLVAFAVAMGATALAARRLAGPVVALGALGLAVASPALVLAERWDSIQIPEVALAATLLAMWLHDPGLERRATVAAMAFLGALLELHADSGLLWLLPLGVGLLAGGSGRWLRTAAVLLVWAAAAVPALGRLADLPPITGLIRPELDVRALAAELARVSGPVGAGLALVAVAAGAFVARGRGRRAPALLLLVWGGLPLLLHGVFRLGLDRFVAAIPVLAVGTAWGLALLHPRLPLVGLALAAWFVGPMWVLRGGGPSALLPAAASEPALQSRYRPDPAWSREIVPLLLDATCTSEAWHGCRVVVEQGLFAPDSREFGLLELFLLAEDRVELRTVYDLPPGKWGRYPIDAAAVFFCGPRDDKWRRFAPDSTRKLLSVTDAAGLQQAWSRNLDGGCSFHWLTPAGRLAHPEALAALPPGRDGGTWTAREAWDVLHAWELRNPSSGRPVRGRASARGPLGFDTDAPEGFDEAEGPALRAAARR